MLSSFDKYWPRLKEYEGTTLDLDPHDSGNWTGGKVGSGQLVGTKYGIDAASHNEQLAKQGIRLADLTEAQAKQIYLDDYAQSVRFNDLPAGVDTVVIDPAINNGVWRASGWLQSAVGTPVDHSIGPKTIAAVRLSPGGAVPIIQTVSHARLSYDQGLGALWGRYGKGWGARIAAVEAFSVSLALAAVPGASPATVQADLTKHAETAAKDAKSAQSSATGVGTTGTVASGGANQGGLDKWAVIMLVAITLLGLGYFLYQRYIHRLRATAYAAEAKKVTTL